MLYVPNTSVLPQIQASNMALQNALLNRSMAEAPRQRYAAPKLPLDPNNPSTWPDKLPANAFGTPEQTRAVVEGHFGNKKTGKKATGMLVGDKWNTNAGWEAEDKKMAERIKRDAMARRGTVTERDTPLWGTTAYDEAVREEENRKEGITPTLNKGLSVLGTNNSANSQSSQPFTSNSLDNSGNILGNFFNAAEQQPQRFNQLGQALNRVSGNTQRGLPQDTRLNPRRTQPTNRQDSSGNPSTTGGK